MRTAECEGNETENSTYFNSKDGEEMTKKESMGKLWSINTA